MLQTQQIKNQNPQHISSSTSMTSCIVSKGSHWLWENRVFDCHAASLPRSEPVTQRAKIVAEARLHFFCLRDKDTSWQCPIPRIMFFQKVLNLSWSFKKFYCSFFCKILKKNCIVISKSNANFSNPVSNGQQKTSKKTSSSSVTDVKGLLQVTLRRSFNAIPLLVTPGRPIVLQLESVWREPR